MAGRVSLDALRAALVVAETELEDIRLFRPRPEAIAEAERRVNELRAQIRAYVAPRPPPEPPRARVAPPPPPENQPFAEALADAWLIGNWNAVQRCLSRVNRDSVDELRLAIAAGGSRRSTQKLLRRLAELEPRSPPPPDPTPVLVVPPQQRQLVDLRDGLVPAERALLLGLHGLKALPGTEPRPLRLVERFLREAMGDDPMLQDLAAATTALGAGVVPLITRTDAADPLLCLTRLATLMLPSGWIHPDQPLPTRVPYFLLRGRLGHCELDLPFDGASTLAAAMQLLHTPEPRRALHNLVGELVELESKHLGVQLLPTLEVEVGRQERRARIVVHSLPRLVSWSRALAHLQALRAAGALAGVTSVQLVSLPKQVMLIAELAHVVYSNSAYADVTQALSANIEVDQRALLDGVEVPSTPRAALDAFLEHRLAVERRANSPQLNQLGERLELVEGRLIAEELGEALTTVLRHCDAVATPNLARWALEHFPSCHTHPELERFERESEQWPEALRSARKRLEQWLVNDWRPSVSMSRGFSGRQSAALENGRAALRRDAGLLTEFQTIWSKIHAEHLATDLQAVQQRVRTDLDTIQVTLRSLGRPSASAP